MKIIGIHDGHNASVCLLIDGEIKTLIQEERLVGVKNYDGFPILSIYKLLEVNKISIDEIDYFAFNGNHEAILGNKGQLMNYYKKSYDFSSYARYFLKKTFIFKIYKEGRRKKRIANLTQLGVNKNKIIFVEHHLCHAATAYYGSPWANGDNEVLIITQDGSGDGLSGTVNIGSKGEIKRIAKTDKSDSLGRIYATVTFMLGMVPLEHEYKLMGLAPYSSKEGADLAYKVFKSILEFKNDLVWKRKRKIPPLQMIYPFIRKNTEYMRFDWIAGGLQNYTEEMLVKLTENAIRNTGIKKVALSGGTFMNVKANQKISEINELENLFIFPSCGDETNAIGAAYYVYKQKNKHGKINPIKHLYYGPDETDDGNVLKEIEIFRNTTTTKFSVTHYDKIESEIARLLVEGAIVARCKGPMEFGARALGNRSILSDASDLSKITIINNMIKMRDFWMPFAPVILKERENDYIINPKKIEASFMVITFNSTDRYKEFIGGIQQNDLTARPQIITEELNPDYYRILKEYERNTGKGVLINTSFNLHGLPIVYGPKEALYVFENSGLKILALGNYLLKKIDL